MISAQNIQKSAIAIALLGFLFFGLIVYYGIVYEPNQEYLIEALIGSYLLILVMLWFLFLKPIQNLLISQDKINEARKSAERLALFPLHSPHPLIQLDLQGEIIFYNNAAHQQFPDIIEHGIEHSVLQGLQGFVAEIEKAHQNNRYEKRVLNREVDYNYKVYHQGITAALINDIPALIIYFYDITAIKTAEAKIRLFEAVVVNAKDGVIITSANLENPQVLFVNDALTQITGYEAQDLLGYLPPLLRSEKMSQNTLETIKSSLCRGRPYRGEVESYKRDGTGYWLDIAIFPVKDENGNITNFAAIERDVTTRKIFEKDLVVAKEKAEVANRAKDDFLANISHELRTPMNGIIGLSELMLEMNLNAEQLELAQAVQGSSRGLLILLNDILDLSKIEANQLTLESIPYDVRRVMRQVSGLLSGLTMQKGIVLETTVNAMVPESILGDPARMQQIMNNLVGNAIKFTEIGYVRLDIGCAKISEGKTILQIRVEDTGIGIPEDKQADIFQKFTQADVSTSRKYGGTGLGLSVTKQLVEIMGGKITLQSAPAKGTTFTVEIPVTLADQVPTIKTLQITPSHFNKTAKILVIDDHPINLLFMKKLLKKLGFSDFDEAHTGVEAIALYRRKEYDLILMDCQMPDMDGFETATIIRKMERIANKTKIIAVTADAMKGARERCMAAGMNDYISKPVETESLKTLLAAWLPAAPANELSSVLAMPKAITKSTKIMDWERLNIFTEGNVEEAAELIGIFSMHALETLKNLTESYADKNNEKWRKAAHKLKGSAMNLGAGALSEICQEAEDAYETDFSIKNDILNRIHKDYKELISLLNARISSDSRV